MEKWKPIPGWEEFYEASDAGRIRSLPRMSRVNSVTPDRLRQMGGNMRTPTKGRGGYLHVFLTAEGRRKRYGVHQLVLLAFRGRPSQGTLTRHLNSEPSDNRLENLLWATQKENMQDRHARGLYYKGEKHPMVKITDEQVAEIRSSALMGSSMAKQYGLGASQISRIRHGKSRA